MKMLPINRLRIFSRLFVPLIMLLVTIVFGTAGYIILENYSFLEALYMTVTTIATVGYGEVRPLSETGRIFTIILILVNLGLFTYFITC